MGKQRKGRRIQRGEKSDFNLESKLKKENKQLKREIKRLRNLLDRVDIGRVEYLENLLEEQREFDKTIKRNREQARKKWLCHVCTRGYMMPRIFKRRDGDFYYRMCNNEDCEHRTRMKKKTPDVDLSLLDQEGEE